MSATADNATTRKQYPFDTIEAEQQRLWHEKNAFRVPNPGEEGFDPAKPKFYVLDMFPYPSGAGLHVGHAEGYTATDIISRYKRMRGFNVLHPMGWDAFGLPAEQYAIKTGQHPRVTTQQNVARFREQLDSIGFSYDWSREINTTDPDYFRWTQWIFRRIYESWFDPEKNQARPISELEEKRKAEKPEENEEDRRAFIDSKRLAYVSHQPVNWSPDLGTVLANEEVEEWTAKGHKVERRPLRQWMLRITEYAQRLIEDLDTVDWPDHVKMLQRNWIGRSEGAFVDFEVWPLDTQAGHGNEKLVQNTLRVFTTRPDTLFGATYMVLAPEHPLVEQITTAEQKEAVTKYQQEIANKSDLERTELAKDKTGVFTGGYAKNPVNDETIPIWIADYVLMGYGTGAIMAVPAHDERDFEFAQKFQLPIRQVVAQNKPDSDRSGGILPSQDFIGLGDFEEFEVIPGKNLPHWRKQGATYAVCFRLADSIPEKIENSYLHYLQALEDRFDGNDDRGNKVKKFQKRYEEILELLDNNLGSCILRNTEAAQIVERALKHFDKDRYELLAWSIMPNHVHVVLKPLGEYTLENIVHSWKSFTANKINALQGGAGKLWQSDFYNRIIRDREELYDQIKYVVYNPVEGNASPEFTGYNKELSQIDLEGEDLRGQDAPATNRGLEPPKEPTTAPGIAINSPLIDGLPTDRAKKTITNWLEQNGKGQGAINYKLRDWLFSRQRYWGEPFPIVWEEKTGQHFSVAEDELPVTLPEMEDFKPSGTPDPPLSKAKDWVRYSETARRETNTMPQWAGSCWYYLRFCDPNCDSAPISKEAEQYWMKNGVDLYIGGVEHAVLHLLYARFWHKVLYDYGVVSEPEPFQRLVNPGIILGADNQKMSKSLGNVVSPEDVMELYGADSLRLFEMFIGPLTQMAPWSMSGVEGVHRFLARTWRLFMRENQEGQWEPSPAVDHSAEPGKEQLKVLHQTIRKVTDDIDALSFNTAISQMMVFVNELTRCETRPWSVLEPFLRLLSPFAPHLAGHLWSGLRQESDGALLMHQAWPEADEKYLVEDEVTLVLQVNGKVRDKVSVTADEAQDKARMEEIARANEKVLKFAEEGEIRKVIVVPGKLVNVVVK